VSIPDALAERRTTVLAVNTFDQTRITGTVRLNQNGILVCQMPFDIGWHAFMNGRAMPTLKVDSGLLGVSLGEGEGMVELSYHQPFLYIGAAVTLIAFLIFLFSLWRWPRINVARPVDTVN